MFVPSSDPTVIIIMGSCQHVTREISPAQAEAGSRPVNPNYYLSQPRLNATLGQFAGKILVKGINNFYMRKYVNCRETG